MSCQGFAKFLRIFGTNNPKNTKYIDTKLILWIFSSMFLSKLRKSQNLVPRSFILGRFGRKKNAKRKISEEVGHIF